MSKWLDYNLANPFTAAYNTYRALAPAARRLFGKPRTARRVVTSTPYSRSFTGGGTKRKRKSSKWKTNKRRTYSLKKKVYKMSKKLAKLPTPAPVLWIDYLKLQYVVPQGTQLYTGFGGASFQTISTPFNFTSSPLDPYYLCAGPLNNNGSSGTLGTEKSILHRWSTEYFFTNIANCPIEIECICLRPKKDLPYIRSWGSASGINATITSFEGWLSHAAAAQFPGLGGLALNDMNTLNPNTSLVTTNTNYTNMPGVKLTDVPLFNEYFKIVSTKKRVVQPGEAAKFVKFRKRPRVINEASLIDYLDVAGSPGGGIYYYGLRNLCKKGYDIYVWKMQSIPVNSAGGGTASVTFCDGHVNLIQTVRMHTSFLAADAYKGYFPTPLPTGVTPKVIFPGTSTANPAAPAT